MFYNYSVSLSLSPPFYVLSLEDVPFEPSTAFIPQPTPRALATVLRYSSFSFSSFASSLLIPTCIASAPKSATFFQNMIVSISLEALNSSLRQNGCIIGVTHETNAIRSLLPKVKFSISNTLPSISTIVPHMAIVASSMTSKCSMISFSEETRFKYCVLAKDALKAALVSANRGAIECSSKWKSDVEFARVSAWYLCIPEKRKREASNARPKCARNFPPPLPPILLLLFSVCVFSEEKLSETRSAREEAQ